MSCRASCEIPLSVGVARTQDQSIISKDCKHFTEEIARGKEINQGDDWILIKA